MWEENARLRDDVPEQGLRSTLRCVPDGDAGTRGNFFFDKNGLAQANHLDRHPAINELMVFPAQRQRAE